MPAAPLAKFSDTPDLPATGVEIPSRSDHRDQMTWIVTTGQRLLHTCVCPSCAATMAAMLACAADLKALAATVAPDIGSGPAVLAEWHAGMVFVADDLAAWLVGLLADAGHKKLTNLEPGGNQSRARSATPWYY